MSTGVDFLRKGHLVMEAKGKLGISLDTSRANYRVRASVLGVGLLILLGLLGLVLFSREYSGPDGPPSPLYAKHIFGFRLVDVLILFISSSLFLIVSQRRLKVWGKLARATAVPLLLFGVAILLSIIYGFMHGGTQLFYEWRDLALGFLLGSAFRSCLRRNNLFSVAHGLFALVSLHSLALMVRWFLLGGVPPYNGPVFDGPTLDNAVAMVSFGVALYYLAAQRRRSSGLWVRYGLPLLIGANAMLVLFAFRRTYWIEFLVNISLIFLLFRATRKWVIPVILTGVLGLYLLFPGGAVWGRLESILHFFDTDNPYATTNLDHLADVLDAIEQIQKSPLFGIGLGTAYETHYATWKSVSWGVHNGPLHVWLRFGLLGLLAYLWFHWRVFVLLWRYRGLALTRALLSYWLAIFIPPLFFSPWPYGALQITALLGTLFALVDAEIEYALKGVGRAGHSRYS